MGDAVPSKVVSPFGMTVLSIYLSMWKKNNNPFLCVMTGERFAVGFYLGMVQAKLYFYALEACSLTFIKEKNGEGIRRE